MSVYASRATLRLSIAAVLASAAPAVTPAFAAEADAQATAGIEQVVVTARRREESLQDVPVAITALTADQLLEQNVRTLEDMTAYAPNIKVNAGRATSSTINAYIRGVGQNDPLWGFEPGVGIYLDDVYIARPQGALLDVYDVDRIEVLRGPQGTLYGKNTIAGAIKYVTRDIVERGSCVQRLRHGRQLQPARSQSGRLDAPIVADHMYVGAAVAWLQRDGYGEIVDDGAPRPYNHVGQDVSDKDVLAARVNATFLWGESSKLRMLGDLIQDDSNAVGGKRLNNLVQPALDDRYDQRTDMPVDQDKFETKGAAATFTQSLSDALDLKIVGAYREGEGRQFIDFEELNANVFQVPAEYGDDQTSGEVQLTYSSDLVKGVGGVYYFTGEAHGAFDASLGANPAPLGPLTSLTKGSVDTESVAAYFDTTWTLDRPAEHERRRALERRRQGSDRIRASSIWDDSPPNATLFDQNNVPTGFVALGPPQTNYTNDRTFSDVSPRFGFDFDVSDNVLAYVSYAQGFKSGGFDMRGNERANPATRDGYDSETADNYEIGIKSTLLDDTLQLNLTAFYTPYEDVQITTQQFQIVNGVPTNVTAVLNAGKQLNQGVELETLWRPVAALTLALNVGCLDAKFEEFLFGCTPPQPNCRVDLSSLNTPINAPEWTTFLGATYEWELGAGDLSAHLGYQYRSDTKVANTTREHHRSGCLRHPRPRRRVHDGERGMALCP